MVSGGDFTEKELALFCAKQDSHHRDLLEPFKIQEKTCACDGKIMLFLERSCERELGDSDKNRRVLDMANKILADMPATFEPFPHNADLSAPEPEKCDDCGGYGQLIFYSDVHSHEYICRCEHCDGEGVFAKEDVFFEPLNVYVNQIHLTRLSKLKDIQITLKNRFLYFSFDGGCGALAVRE